MNTDRLIYWICLVLMILVPSAFFPITYNQTLTKDLILGLTGAIILFIAMLKSNKRNLFKFNKTLSASLGIYIMINIISLLINPTYSDSSSYVVHEIIFILFFYLYIYIAKTTSEYTLVRFLSCSNLVVLIVGLIQIILHYNKPYSTFGNPNYFGGYLVAVWPLMAVGLRDHRRMFKGLALINLFLFLINAIYIRSWAMYLVLILSMYFLIPMWMKSLKIRFLGWVIMTIMVVGFWNIKSIQDSLIFQIANDIRPYIWKGTVQLIQQYPLLGCGAGQYGIFYPIFRIPEYFTHPLSVDNTDHAHCELLEMLSEIGIVGILAFLIFLFLTFRFVIKGVSKLNRDIQLIAYGAIIGVFLLLSENMFDVNLRYTSSKYIFWLLLGWGCGLSLKSYSFENQSFRIKLIYKVFGIILISIVLSFFYITPYLADIYFKRGVYNRNNQEYKNAISNYEKAVSINSVKIEAYYRLAYLYGVLGENEKAVKAYHLVISISPYYSSVHGNLGTIYLRMGDLENAYKHLVIQTQLNPYDPDRLCTLASVLLQMGKEEEAKKYLRKALIYNPKHPFALKILKRGN